MNIIDNNMSEKEHRAAAIGNFDGVHCGHRLVVKTLMENAAKMGLTPTVFVLDRHPLELIAPNRAPGMLMSLDDKRTALRRLGPEVVTIKFDADTRHLTSMEYMKMLQEEFGVSLLVVGYDNRFGSDIDSDFSTYEEQGRSIGMKVVEAPCLAGISSSAIRRSLLSGNVEDAASMLGAPYRLRGIVGHGDARGASLGFPTANLKPASERSLIPAGGVYAAAALLPDGSYRRAMVNIGTCPTFKSGLSTIEAHLLDYSGDLYGQPLALDFISRLRNERKMNSVAELCNQLETDRRAVADLDSRYFHK